MSGKESVEEGNEEDNGDCHQSSMPALVDVAFVVQNDKTLDLGSG